MRPDRPAGVTSTERAGRVTPRPSTGPSVQRRILALQSTLGNRGFRQVTGAGERRLARFDTGEHAQFGSDDIVYVRGDVQITESEMIALGGDLYERPEDLEQADLDELRKLVALVRRDRSAYVTHWDDGVSNDEWEQATPEGPHRKKTFLELAEDNATHFAPRADGSDGRDHKAEWERIHRQALDLAHNSKSPADDRRALEYNAFAAHFLTDAFAAGHMFSKQDVIDFAVADWKTDYTAGTFVKTSWFTDHVAKLMLGDSRVAPKFAALEVHIVHGWQEIDETNLSELLYGISDKKPGLFFGTFVKLIHDALNSGGLDVTNDNGDAWRIYGDQNLARSPETLRIANAAIKQSRRNLTLAKQAIPGAQLDYQPFLDAVWAYTPRPTKEARFQIEQLIGKYGNPLNKKTERAFENFTADHIDSIIRKLKAEGNLRDKT
jgi:hypothetical protein